LSADIRKAKYR